jgi:hypothetical protein
MNRRTRRPGLRDCYGIAGEGARATLAYFPAAALPSSLASMAGLEQTS